MFATSYCRTFISRDPRNNLDFNRVWYTTDLLTEGPVKNVKWCNHKGELPFNRKLSDPLYSTKQEFFNSASFLHLNSYSAVNSMPRHSSLSPITYHLSHTQYRSLFLLVGRWSESPVARPRPAKDKKYKICGSFLRLLVSVISDMKKRKDFYGE